MLCQDDVCDLGFTGIPSGFFNHQEFRITIIDRVIYIHNGSGINKAHGKTPIYLKNVHGHHFYA